MYKAYEWSCLFIMIEGVIMAIIIWILFLCFCCRKREFPKTCNLPNPYQHSRGGGILQLFRHFFCPIFLFSGKRSPQACPIYGLFYHSTKQYVSPFLLLLIEKFISHIRVKRAIPFVTVLVNLEL